MKKSEFFAIEDGNKFQSTEFLMNMISYNNSDNVYW